MTTDLSTYNNSWYNSGSRFKRGTWYIISFVFFQTAWFPFSSLKVAILRALGATIGKGVVIKPGVQIKYPWNLTIGNHVWVGEGVWIDNLAPVTIGSHACLSQGAYLLTGNHNFTLPSFDLIIKGIVLEEGVWIGAKAVVCPGVTCASHAVLAVGSVATKDLERYTINQGNPAIRVKSRSIISADK